MLPTNATICGTLRQLLIFTPRPPFRPTMVLPYGLAMIRRVGCKILLAEGKSRGNLSDIL